VSEVRSIVPRANENNRSIQHGVDRSYTSQMRLNRRCEFYPSAFVIFPIDCFPSNSLELILSSLFLSIIEYLGDGSGISCPDVT
jgi:hypothetical protein